MLWNIRQLQTIRWVLPSPWTDKRCLMKLSQLSFPANNKHVGFDPKSLWLADPCPVPAAQSCESESTDGKGSVTGRCNGSCPPLCSMALLTCADTVASVVAPALCPLDAKHVEVKEEGDQVDHHYMTYIQVFALLCREKYHKNSFFFPLSFLTCL